MQIISQSQTAESLHEIRSYACASELESTTWRRLRCWVRWGTGGRRTIGARRTRKTRRTGKKKSSYFRSIRGSGRSPKKCSWTRRNDHGNKRERHCRWHIRSIAVRIEQWWHRGTGEERHWGVSEIPYGKRPTGGKVKRKDGNIRETRECPQPGSSKSEWTHLGNSPAWSQEHGPQNAKDSRKPDKVHHSSNAGRLSSEEYRTAEWNNGKCPKKYSGLDCIQLQSNTRVKSEEEGTTQVFHQQELQPFVLSKHTSDRWTLRVRSVEADQGPQRDQLRQQNLQSTQITRSRSWKRSRTQKLCFFRTRGPQRDFQLEQGPRKKQQGPVKEGQPSEGSIPQQNRLEVGRTDTNTEHSQAGKTRYFINQ